MRKLLVIDDHDDIRENIAEILTLAGYKVFTAENGKRGVETALKENPELVICDVMMPELDGYGRPAPAEKERGNVEYALYLPDGQDGAERFS